MSDRLNTISDGLVVAIHYTLKNDAGETLDSSIGMEPLEYLHGAGNIVPGLEDALSGKSLGENFQVVVAPEDGYGERDPRGVRAVPRSAFPPDVQIETGMQFFAEDKDGDPLAAWIVGTEGERVMIDLNHPLAGVTLHFDVTVDALRDATAEELAHGHPHGAGGHDHGDDDGHGHDHGHGHGHAH